MGATSVSWFRSGNGRYPLQEWLKEIPIDAHEMCTAATKRLKESGDELGMPVSEYLGDKIYELRIKQNRIQYRILYFFLGKDKACLSHGFVKKTRKTPPEEIERAIRHKNELERKPK